jgi:tRNA 2-thiocytidine biosynthesis protein TtcA
MFADSKIKTRLLRRMGEAIKDFQMIEDGDRVMVCLSGGKDSPHAAGLTARRSATRAGPLELLAVNLDQKQPGFPAEVLPNYLRRRDVPFRIVERDTYSVVKRLVPEGKTSCAVCSRCDAAFSITSRSKKGAQRSRSDIMRTTSSQLSCSTFFTSAR